MNYADSIRIKSVLTNCGFEYVDNQDDMCLIFKEISASGIIMFLFHNRNIFDSYTGNDSVNMWG